LQVTYETAALNELATHILHGVSTGATYKEVSPVLEKPYGDHHLEASIHAQLKRRTQHTKECLQEFAAIIDYLAYHAFVRLPKHLISKEAAHA
jgi:hypothetical protein